MATSGSLNFLSSSLIGSSRVAGAQAGIDIFYGHEQDAASTSEFVPNDFVGLNTNINEPISSSSNTLGYDDFVVGVLPHPGGSGLTSYIITYAGGRPTNFFSSEAKAKVLNGLLHHRNGPYQHPTWKQWRGAEHPVARYQRLHNTMSIDTRNPIPITKHINLDNYGPEGRPDYHTTVFSGSVSIQKLEQFYEPAVVSKYKPFIYDVPINVGNIITNAKARARQSLFNQMTFFSNKGLNNALKLSNANPLTSSQFTRNKQKVYSLFHVARDIGASRFVFHETIYPRSVNAYRKYKLEKPNYEESSGYGTNGFDRNHGLIRSFWRNVPSSSLSHNKTERLRTVELALNSQDVTQSMKYTPAPETLSDVYDHGIAWRYDTDGDGDIDSTDTNLTSGDTWAHASKLSYLPNGIVTNQTRVGYENNDLVDPLASDESPHGPVRPRYIQLDSHQPYQINLNSMWPLDAVAFNMIRRHEPETTIEGFTTPAKYLSFTHGAMGTQIGLTPNAKFGNFDLFHTGTNISLPFKDGTFTDWDPGRTPWPTRSAGELVYSTKPTIFFYRQLPTSVTTGSNGDGKHGPIGYNAATASMQYLRHTYPYQSPWWVTNLVVSESLGPMYDTYNDFIGNDLKYISRDYTAIPEFRISENYKYYDEIIRHYRQNSTTKVFELDEEYDETLGAKTFKVKRNFGVESNFYAHKLDFLKIHGADVTASSDIESLSRADLIPFTTNRWSFDDIKNFKLTDNTKDDRHYQNVSGSEYFNQRYVHTDSIKNFTYLMHDKGFGSDVVPSEISFECDAIKKLLPYEGFYPMTRTVQIGSYFKKAFEPHIIEGYNFKNEFKDSDTYTGGNTATGSHVLVVDGTAYETISGSGVPGGQTLDSKKQAMIQALLEPFFAPGLLYNSIKSGIAVDYPVYLQKPPQYYGSAMSASEAINAAIPNDSTFNGQQDELLKMTTGSLGHGGYQMMGVANAMPAYLMSRPDYRMPFEALYDLKKMDILNLRNFQTPDKAPYSNFLVSDFLWGSGSNRITGKRTSGGETILPRDQGSLDYVPNARINKLPSNINTSEMRLYESSINNYLAETMEFFLEPQDAEKNVRFPIIATRRLNRLNGAIPGVKYYMDLRLEMGQDHVMCEGPRRSNFIFSSSIAYAEGPLSSSLRGYLYGPPMQTIPTLESTPGSSVGAKGGNGSHHHFNFESAFAANLTDPAYQAWTPPYFYGDSRITFKYRAHALMEEFEVAHKRILTSSFYFEKYNVSGGLTPKIPSTSSVSLGSFTRMKIDASIDMFNEPIEFDPAPGFGGDELFVWYAMPKWVCPVLDFSSSIASRYETVSYDEFGKRNMKIGSVNNPYHDETTGKSMWGGYGTDPYDKNMMTYVDVLSDKAVGKRKGIYFSLSETFAENAFETTSAPGYVSDFESPDGYFIQRDSTINSPLTSSLVQLLFPANKQDTSLEIGKIASGKKISEAVAIIPYFDQPVELNFTSVIDDDFDGVLEDESKDINSKILHNVFRTRQIIPGKFFLGIHDQTFEKVLSTILIEKFYKSDSTQYEDLTKNWRNYDEHNQSTLSNAINCDIGKMILNLIGQINSPSHRGYQLPPEFDFIHNKKIKPFQMIILPFEHNLHKQDLIDIYQGVMSPASQRAEDVFSKINVHPGLQHAIDDPNLISSFTVPASSEGTGVGDSGGKIMLTNFNLANFLSPLPLISDLRYQIADALNESQNVRQYEAKSTGITSSKEFYEKIKFMVFKIKQRGVSNYRRYKERNLATYLETNTRKMNNERLKFRNFPRSYDIYADEIYGPNWPYDNFSLIETARIDTKIKVD